MKKMTILFALILALAWIGSETGTAHAQMSFAFDMERLAEIADTDAELLAYRPQTTFRNGYYKVELLYESSIAENVNQFGWTKSPFCLTAVPVEAVALDRELSARPHEAVAVKKRFCGCGGFHEIFSGETDPVTTRFVCIPEPWAPALNSPSIRGSHGGGYYTSLTQYNWDRMDHVQIYEEIDPTGISASPSWLLLWMDTCSPYSIPIFFDDMIVKITYMSELCPADPVPLD